MTMPFNIYVNKMIEIDNSMLAELEQESRLIRARNARLEAEVTVLTEMVRVLSDKIAELENKQEQGEPVAWMRTSGTGSPVVTEELLAEMPEIRWNFQQPLYTTPQPKQEQGKPVAWMDIDEKGAVSDLRYWSEPDNRHEVALYTKENNT